MSASGLSTDEALAGLRQDLDGILTKYTMKMQNKQFRIVPLLYAPHFIAIFHTLVIMKLLKKSLVLFLMFAFTIWCEWKEWKLFGEKDLSKLQALKKTLYSLHTLTYNHFDGLENESLKLFKVKRDGSFVTIPDILLVKGDLVHDAEGKMYKVQKSGISSMIEECGLLQDDSQFKKDGKRWLSIQISLLRNSIACITIGIFSIALAFNRTKLFTCAVYYSIFNVVPWVFLLRAYASCRILVLWDLLKLSKKSFDDVDEFDENEPPPTIDLQVPLKKILSKMQKLLFAKDSGSDCRFSLLDEIALTSFVVYTDRCGTLCNSYPLISKVLVFSENAIVEQAVILDTVPFEGSSAGFQFEDRGWINFKSSLKPLGLATALIGSCQLERKDCWHQAELEKLQNYSISIANQMCFCSLARVIGLAKVDVENFQFWSKFLLNLHIEQLCLSFTLKAKCYKDCKSQVYILIVEGPPEALMPFANAPEYGDFDTSSGGIWTGSTIQKLEGFYFKKIDNFAQICSNSDTISAAFAIKALESPPKQHDETFNLSIKKRPEELQSINKEIYSLLSGITIVGVVGISFEPKEDVSSFIDDLEQAGIRFVYLSPFDQKSTKAFGERLGLETDWNSCIILAEPPEMVDENNTSFCRYQDLSDIKAHLPQGPAQIQQHLQNVDDIPLHVSLFAHSLENKGQEIRELFSIFRENGETVCLVGNCLNSTNFSLFRHADISIGMTPFTKTDTSNAFHLAVEVTSTFCSLKNLSFQSSPYLMTEIIREGRTLMDNAIQMLVFISTIGVAMCLYSSLAMNSSIWNWERGIATVITPIVAASFIWKTHDQSIMKHIPAKTNEYSSGTFLYNPKYNFYYFAIKSLMLTFSFLSLDEIWTIVSFQVIISSLYLHRNLSLKQCFVTQRNYVWMVLSSLFLFSLAKSWFKWKVLFFFLVNLGLSEICKKHDRTVWTKNQKMLKFEFNTRLGMHSPV
jgi:hypothetical protein